jgi:hypothetical protein
MLGYIYIPTVGQPSVGQGLHNMHATRSQAYHNGYDSSGRVISLTQWPVRHKTQHSHETTIHAPKRFEPAVLARQRPQTHALNRTATRIVQVTVCVQ